MTTETTSPAQPAFQFSRPVQIDQDQIDMDDMRLLSMAATFAADEQAANAALPEILEMLRRVVVGGLKRRPREEVWYLYTEVLKQLGEPQKNSGTGS